MRVKAPLVAFLALALATCVSVQEQQVKTLKIFHAGSLTIPLTDLSEAFKNYTKSKGYSVDILLEPSGSVKAVRKVTDLSLAADLVAVADYRLLQKLMYPNYTDFYIMFARNEIVLCYTNHSKYSGTINSTNWFNVLSIQRCQVWIFQTQI